MSRLLIVANRLPVTLERRRGEHRFKQSVGGVATGLDSLRKPGETVWIGWAETSVSRIDGAERDLLREELRSRFDAEPVFLTPDDVAGFYHGFSNRTIWPLFHYFSRYAEFRPDFWKAYERVNRKYRDAVLEAYRPGDRIWVHDYQLMLLPAMLREKLPDAAIGFFLHIPFPSYEIFRLLPWRKELLQGILGAGLIGFHTHDYVNHFLGSVRALVGLEDRNGRLTVDGRVVVADVFPMGIDVARYRDGATLAAVVRERAKIAEEGRSIVLSIDRLDYTKGVPERLRAFDAFLEQHQEWREKVTMVCVAVPSRSRVWRYRELKREVDELVGDINGRHGTMTWTPVRYLYRSLPFNVLLGLYSAADVALVTPVRDGMNLIAKEYVAVHAEKPGVLVLSEMAGAAREMSDALVVNPHDESAVVAAIERALTMPVDEQVSRNTAMLRRLERYDVRRWAEDFLGKLDEVMMLQLAYEQYDLTQEARERIVGSFVAADRRLIVLDYDGTLVPFAASPSEARPDSELLDGLRELANLRGTDVVIASGRGRESLEEWFGRMPVGLVAEHGAWLREAGGEWATLVPISTDWKQRVAPVLEVFVDRTPNSFVEDKQFAMAWHYRKVAGGLGRRRSKELRDELSGFANTYGLSILDGDRVVEIKGAGVDKGSAAYRWMGRPEYDFVLVIGDDATDEDLFAAAPDSAWTIKSGHGPSQANFAVRGPDEVRALLSQLRTSQRVPVPR
jgi:trehalose 6-phosphate synthase/phosphatase